MKERVFHHFENVMKPSDAHAFDEDPLTYKADSYSCRMSVDHQTIYGRRIY